MEKQVYYIISEKDVILKFENDICIGIEVINNAKFHKVEIPKIKCSYEEIINN